MDAGFGGRSGIRRLLGRDDGASLALHLDERALLRARRQDGLLVPLELAAEEQAEAEILLEFPDLAARVADGRTSLILVKRVEAEMVASVMRSMSPAKVSGSAAFSAWAGP